MVGVYVFLSGIRFLFHRQKAPVSTCQNCDPASARPGYTQEHTIVKTQGHRPAGALSGLLSPRVHPAEHSLRVPRGHTASPIGARRRCVRAAQLCSR